MSEELKPCPFCGGKALYCPPDYQDARHIVICNGYDCIARPSMHASSRKHVITDWNTRPVEDALRAKVAYLESALNDAETNVHKALSAFNELDAQWESVPWESIGHCLSVAIYGAPLQRETAQAALDWWHAHAENEAAK